MAQIIATKFCAIFRFFSLEMMIFSHANYIKKRLRKNRFFRGLKIHSQFFLFKINQGQINENADCTAR